MGDSCPGAAAPNSGARTSALDENRGSTGGWGRSRQLSGAEERVGRRHVAVGALDPFRL